MIKHAVEDYQKDPDEEVDIVWHLEVDNKGLRLIGRQNRVKEHVISIYNSGVLYKHRNLILKGLKKDDKGRIASWQSGTQEGR